MEVSRILWWLLATLLAALCVCDAQYAQYDAGDIRDGFNWYPHQNDVNFYQRWAGEPPPFYVNDSIYFSYDSTKYDVTQVGGSDALSSCSIADIQFSASGGATLVYFIAAGDYYLMSTGLRDNGNSPDCLAGMKIVVTVLDRLSPASSPPPHQQTPSLAPGPAQASAPPPASEGSPGISGRYEIPWRRQTDPNVDTNLTLPTGTVLVLTFDKSDGVDSVLRVSQADYENCTLGTGTRPLATYYTPGPAVVPLTEHDIYYFIDGVPDNCVSGRMKLQVQVGKASPPPQTGNATSKAKFPLAAVLVPCAIVLILGLALLLFLYCRHQYGSKPRGRYEERHVVTSTGFAKSVESSAAAISGILKGKRGGNQCTIYTYHELERATNSFSKDNEVGSGGFGTVYKGTLDDGTTVAIKMAKHASDVESFVNEVSILSGVNNRNLVKLLGCCVDMDIPLLVYEFIPNGNLQDHLSISHKGFTTHLDWETRFKIALQTAEALKYLHVQATPPIFHRDVKSANILLDHNWHAKVADFGFSKLVDLEATHVSTAVKGTPGYLDPEYYYNSQLTDKTDVYSFGVVLLELITSNKPVDLSKPGGEQNLALSSIPLIKAGRCREIIDTQMSSNLSSRGQFQEVEAVAKVAVACLVFSRASRPSMTEVLEMLQRIKGSQLKAEEFYGRADTQSAILEMQALSSLPGSVDYSAASSGQATSSSGSGDVTVPVRPR